MKELLEQFVFSLKERGLTKSTQASYSSIMKKFFIYANKDPLEVTMEDIRKFQVHLIDKSFAPRTINQNMAAIKFFYLKTLKRDWPEDFIAWVKVRRRLPFVLSPEEVADLLNAAKNSKQRTLLMTMYAAGLRPSEVRQLRAADIDSKRMLIHVRFAKGEKERFVTLSPLLLEVLRAYWKNSKEDKSVWLFPGEHDPKIPYSQTSLGRAYRAAKKKAGIQKPGGPHTLRHCFATHHLEMGTDLRIIQVLLGHTLISTTTKYTHLRQSHVAEMKSPLDLIAEKLKRV
ncbi:MAG: tyrosine-type recombinase/integrase [Pseudobdellovibrionaceae bacterium]